MVHNHNRCVGGGGLRLGCTPVPLAAPVHWLYPAGIEPPINIIHKKSLSATRFTNFDVYNRVSKSPRIANDRVSPDVSEQLAFGGVRHSPACDGRMDCLVRNPQERTAARSDTNILRMHRLNIEPPRPSYITHSAQPTLPTPSFETTSYLAHTIQSYT